ncbi:MAG: FkbM family methyltransferase [Halofilum sp. (in: g-proteobacteria)]|nr:FkbM family methyltransferase [Halofilum sp. (in: g-proteobacteria)]
MQWIPNRLLASLVRKKLRRHLRSEPGSIDTVEAELRNMRGLAPAPATETLNDFASHALRRSDSKAYFKALERAHRVVIREQPKPALRSYRANGFHVEHDIRNTAEWSTYIRGDHDRGVQYWIGHYLNEGDTAIDVGANVGIFTLQMARSVTSAGRVLAFEPHPLSISALRRNLALNHMTDEVEVHELALGETDCDMTITVPGTNQGSATLRQRASNPENGINVPVRNFSHWIRQYGDPSAKIIKIDVEGFELSVLKGMAQYLEREAPVLLIELTPRDRIEETREALDLLNDLGFGLRRIIDEPPYALPMPESLPKQMDILCMKPAY